MNLSTPISTLNRVGKTTASRLKRLGLETAKDLLYYFPFRYEDYRQIVPIKDLRDGLTATVQGKIELIANRRSLRKRKMITEALVSDDTGSVRVVWFNQPFLTQILHPGDAVSLSGAVKGDMLGSQLVSPAYEKITKRDPSPYPPLERGGGIASPPLKEGTGWVVSEAHATHTARLVPIYSLTEGITEKQIRFLIKQVLPLAKAIPEWLPGKVIEEFDLVPLPAALEGIHFPKDEIDLQKSTERLKFDELFLIQLQAELARLENISYSAPALAFREPEIKEFVAKLPFQLTKAQKVAAWEILQDIGKRTPMNRLLSGDVGSGKTVVAAMAMFNTALNGYQAAMMAPTEVLAQQHYNSLSRLLGDSTKVALLAHSKAESVHGVMARTPSDPPTGGESRGTSPSPDLQSQLGSKNKGITTSAAAKRPPRNDAVKSKASKRKELLEKIKSGEVNVVVGTHALLSEGVDFDKLGLVVVDEQHRFGVEQRKIIKEKGIHSSGKLPPLLLGKEGMTANPHFLSMTATPIPRSLALMLYGDLDVSIINEMPVGRKKIITRLVEPAKREKAYGFIREQVKSGRQVFVVCPLIAERITHNVEPVYESNVPRSTFHVPEINDKKSVLSEYKKLSGIVFPDLRVSYLHGKMKSTEKDEIMSKFKDREIVILVSTSVVEVGIDIPNASVMMIEGADRFGLAQLHQFRGRVGRSEHQSYCLLFTDANSNKVKERLQYFEQHTDGFKLAEKDLEIRGPGEVYGTQQSGMMQLRLAKLTDRAIIKKARDAAKAVAPELSKYPELEKKVEEWKRTIHLE